SAAKYRRVPRRTEYLSDFHMTDLQWLALDFPINLAFFTHDNAAKRCVACYPSPRGATQALPPPAAGPGLLAANLILRDLQPDVEALLVNRLGPTPEAYCVGIDECYTLVGIVRMHWRGMSGGTVVWREVAQYFANLKERAHHA